MIESVFKENDIKLTKQRKIIYEIVLNSEEDSTIKSIINKCNGLVDMVTVYRVIDLFIKKQLFFKNVDYSGEVVYTVNNHNHDHYLTCINCKKRETLSYCPIENLKNSIEKENGFLIVSHNMELSGLCNECKKK